MKRIAVADVDTPQIEDEVIETEGYLLLYEQDGEIRATGNVDTALLLRYLQPLAVEALAAHLPGLPGFLRGRPKPAA